MNSKFVVIVAAIALADLTGCAFHPSAPGNVESVTTPLVQPSESSIAIDWSNEPNPRLSEKVKSLRGLRSTDKDVYEAEAPVTLPFQVPGTVFLIADLPASVFSEPVVFSRARFVTTEAQFQVVSEPLQTEELDNGKRRIVLKASGLNVILTADRSFEGQLELEIYGGSKRLSTIRTTLRTPPSHLRVEALGVREWRDQNDGAHRALLRPEIAGKHLTLIRALRLHNEESVPVEIQLARRPAATFSQWTNPMNYRDTGCGYTVDEAPQWISFADEILALPISEQLIPEATASLANTQLADRLSLTIAPGDQITIGYYAIGDRGRAWLDGGPEGPALRRITVPTDCYRVCLDWECVCARCGADVLHVWHFSEQQMTPFLCHCSQYENRRNATDITVGVNRGAMTLSIPAEHTQWTARFGDLAIRRDSEVRMIPVIPASSEVSWF